MSETEYKGVDAGATRDWVFADLSRLPWPLALQAADRLKDLPLLLLVAHDGQDQLFWRLPLDRVSQTLPEPEKRQTRRPFDIDSPARRLWDAIPEAGWVRMTELFSEVPFLGGSWLAVDMIVRGLHEKLQEGWRLVPPEGEGKRG